MVGHRKSCSTAIILLSWFAFCICWSSVNHQIVAIIAQNHLTKSSKEQVNYYLQASLVDVANWADTIRNFEAWKFTAPYHYSNIPDKKCDHNMTRDCKDSQCIVGAVQNYTQLLINRRNIEYNVSRDSLKFLVHFIGGDIHQPLHIGWQSDFGGNVINVTWFNKSTNLHQVWDSLILSKRITDDFSGNVTKFIQYLEGKAINKYGSICDIRNPIDCPNIWASKSASLACTYAYSFDNPNLNETYYKRAVSVVEDQLLSGGLQLATWLNWIFDY